MLGSSSPLNLGGFPASRFPELFVLNFLLLKAPENIFNIQQKIYAQKTLYADHYTLLKEKFQHLRVYVLIKKKFIFHAN